MNKIFRPLAFSLLASSVVGTLSAANQTWTGTTSTNFSVGTNWSGGAAPGTFSSPQTGSNTDIATFDTTVTSNANVALNSDSNLGGFAFTGSSMATGTGSYDVGATGGKRFYFSLGGQVSMDTYVAPAQKVERVGFTGTTDGSYTFVNNALSSAATLTFASSIVNYNTGATNLILAGTNTGLNTLSGFNISSNTGAGALSLTKNDTGTWILDGTNYGGGSIVLGGGITQNNGTLVLYGTNITSNADFTLNGGVLGLRGGAAMLGGSGSNLVITGGRVVSLVSSRTLVNNLIVQGDFALGAAGTVAGSSTASTTFSGGVNLTGAARTLTFTNSATFTGVISNGALILNSDTSNIGATLSGASTYAGGTTINSGRHYANNATAFGTGSVTLAGGNLRLSNSTTPAALALQLGAGANFLMNGGTWTAKLGTAFDQIVGNGGIFTISGGTLALDTTTLSGFNYGTTYQILSSFAGGSTVSGLAITGYDTTNYVANLDNTGLLSFTSAIPEPSTTAMIAGFMALAVVGIRRRLTKR